MELTPDQLIKLQSLGVTPPSKTTTTYPKGPQSRLKPLVPLLSLTGVTLVAATSIIILKNQTIGSQSTPPPKSIPETPQSTPTQVPKSIQHYLLSSQTYFSQAISLSQTNNSDPNELISHLNNAIVAATQAIETYPADARGYEQRGRIYLSLIDSRPQYLAYSISDFSAALKFNPSSSQNAQTLASLHARQGNSASTLHYLSLALSLDPTNPQYFYDLARIQQQTGRIPEALATYQRLLPLITDPNQKYKLEQDTLALQNLAAQNPSPPIPTPPNPTPTFAGPLLQAYLIPASSTGVVVASPESVTAAALQIDSTSGNSLSGTSILLAGSKSILIANDHLKSNSQVYLTTVRGGKNQSLEIISKTSSSFTVGISTPISEDIEFKYWIVD